MQTVYAKTMAIYNLSKTDPIAKVVNSIIGNSIGANGVSLRIPLAKYSQSPLFNDFISKVFDKTYNALFQRQHHLYRFFVTNTLDIRKLRKHNKYISKTFSDHSRYYNNSQSQQFNQSQLNTNMSGVGYLYKMKNVISQFARAKPLRNILYYVQEYNKYNEKKMF